MKPPLFDFLSAETLTEATDALSRLGDDARVLAGGQSLMPMLNMRLTHPELLVDIGRIEDLSYIREENGAIAVGAATTQSMLKGWEGLAAGAPLLALALPHVGHIQTRNRGTVCGSLCHADPSSEIPLCLATLGGEVVLESARGRRRLDAATFQTGMLATAKAPDEILVEARFPAAQSGYGFAFEEITRRHGDFAIVALAAMAWGTTVRLGVGGVADKPAVREWDGLDGDALDDAINAFAWEMRGSEDIHATARYRREMVRTIGRRVIEEARRCRS